MFEGSARPYPPRDVYQAYLSRSDVFIGIYWQRYGWIEPGRDISGLEDQYRLSAGKPSLLYVSKSPAPDREAALEALLERIRRRRVDILSPVHDGRRLAAAGQRRSGSSPDRPVRELCRGRHQTRSPSLPSGSQGIHPGPGESARTQELLTDPKFASSR